MGLQQPSETSPHFGQTCLFTNSLKFGTTNCGLNIWEIREKAGFSKMGTSCRRLVYNNTNARDDMTMRCDFGLVRLYRGKIFARRVYNNTNARNDMTMRCLLSERCVCI